MINQLYLLKFLKLINDVSSIEKNKVLRMRQLKNASSEYLMSTKLTVIFLALITFSSAAEAHRPRKPLEELAYKNPPASLIYNHPARGMKHNANHENVGVYSGTPRAYQRLGASLFYGPYFYSPRDRDARPEWQINQ
jgi:hypothetical protein